ncbi:ABC transporter of the mitochondrion 2 [Striga asiatica]|uniref:ABC transporter of the mitochondrion 2 n=1 Tax=Striga asiatica TaxID=4170 RepID=A0A5A7QRU1_STRAF|nr:ABC transporter of the mitochondrion 2 [Striga asiatica]
MNSIAANFLPSNQRLPLNCPKISGLITIKRAITVKAKKNDKNNDHGKSVDENMIVLKMRIKKMKALESIKNEASKPSSDWLEWENKFFRRYHENICDSMEFLQSYLMNTRPSVAMGMLILVAMSFSSSVVMVNALKMAKELLAGCHVCIDINF